MSKMNNVTTIETSEDSVNLVMNVPKSKLGEERFQNIIANNIKTLNDILYLNEALYSSDWDPTIKIVININKNETQNTKCNNIDNNYLGDHVTEEQSAAIARADFSELPIGAYWTIITTNYRIMAHDQFYGYNGIDTHHVVVMPDTIYSMQNYNNDNVNTGGYIGSVLKSFIESIYVPHIINVFGENHVLSHMHDLTGGDHYRGTLTPISTVAWLVNSYNVNGYKNPYDTHYDWQDADKTQFPAFENDPSLRSADYNGSENRWWLGSSRSNNSYNFCYVSSFGGMVYGSYASYSHGVRPAFLVY